MHSALNSARSFIEGSWQVILQTARIKNQKNRENEKKKKPNDQKELNWNYAISKKYMFSYMQ